MSVQLGDQPPLEAAPASPAAIAADDCAAAGVAAARLVLGAMGFTNPEDHFAADLWAVLLQGCDARAAAPVRLQAEAVLPAALAQLARSPPARLLILAPRGLVLLWQGQLRCWGAAAGVEVDVATLGRGAHRWPQVARCALGSPLDLQSDAILGIGAETGQGLGLLLVLVELDALLEEGARELLRGLPAPEQVVVVAEAFGPAAHELAGEVLNCPVEFSFHQSPDLPPAALAPAMLDTKPEASAAPPPQPAKRRRTGGCLCFDERRQIFKFPILLADGRKSTFQTTVKAAGGSKELAERVALLCRDRYEEGMSKQELFAYRDSLYQHCARAGPEGQSLPDATGTGRRVGQRQAANQEDLRSIAKFMANIVCRSRDPQLREEVLSIVPGALERKAKAPEATRPAPQPASTLSREEEDKVIREGILELLLRHDAALAARAAAEFGQARCRGLAAAPAPDLLEQLEGFRLAAGDLDSEPDCDDGF